MTNEQWENVLSRAGSVLNFGIEKKEHIKNSKMAKLIAAAPYLAGCNKALEISFSHLMIYLMSLDESAKDIFFHKHEDDNDIYLRLFPINNFSGGNKDIIQCCMDLTALCMLSNYKKDAVEDTIIGKYNPISTGKWNYDILSIKLIQNIDNTTNSEISEIYTKEDALKGYWSN
jgi:hypothetical protein